MLIISKFEMQFIFIVLLIELENGDAIEPTNLTEFSSSVSISDGQKVWVKYHSISAASICMVGPIVQIDELEER